MSAPTPGRIEIGGIARAHGIRGEVVVHTHDPDSEVLETAPSIWVGGVERIIEEARGTPRGWLVLLAGVATRNDAEALRGQIVEIDRAVLDLADGDVLLADLVGCRVEREDGAPWGTIVAVDGNSMQDLLVIHDGEIERLLPLVDEFVTHIDTAAKLVRVAPPANLPQSKV